MKKWPNIRDSFQKCEKQQKLLKKSGSGKSTSKTYIYGTQLQFLKKTFQKRSTIKILKIIHSTKTTHISKHLVPESENQIQ